MSSDGYYKWINNALRVCAESNNLYLEVKYGREDRFKPCLSLDGTIRDRTDTLCQRNLRYLRSTEKRFPKHCFPDPDELIDTLELLGVTISRGNGITSLNMLNSTGVAVMCGRVILT